MNIHTLSLLYFRNFNSLNLTLSPNVNIFYGDNAQGKTNLLESVYLCAAGRSQRTMYIKELIQFGMDEAHIQMRVKNGNALDRIDMHLKKNEKKGIAINGLPIKKLGDLFGVLYVVIFSPEDLNLIKAGPAERRRFMDMELCQLSKVYYYELQQYYTVLKQRNNLLKSVRDNSSLCDTLQVWDESLVARGVKIMKYRKSFVDKISDLAGKVHESVTGGKEELIIRYRPNVTAEEFYDRLVRSRKRDMLYGGTSFGIHKDDLAFAINNEDVRMYGSQGQQRTAALSSKLAEIELIREEKNHVPVLLLDDVMSELDESRQTRLIESIVRTQSIITCTGAEDVIKKIPDAALYKVERGDIRAQERKK